MKNKYQDKIYSIRSGIAIQNATIAEIEEQIKALDESISSLKPKTEAVPA